MTFREELLAEFESLLGGDAGIVGNLGIHTELSLFMSKWVDQVLRSPTSQLIYILAHDRGVPSDGRQAPQGGAIHKHHLAQMFGLRVVMAEVDRRIPPLPEEGSAEESESGNR